MDHVEEITCPLNLLWNNPPIVIPKQKNNKKTKHKNKKEKNQNIYA
jgi:hypothetical protein